MRVVELPAGGVEWPKLFLVADELAAVLGNGTLRVFDVRGDDRGVVLERTGVVAAIAAGPAAIVTLDGDGLVTRWDLRGGRFSEGARIQLPAALPQDRLAASACGRFALVDGRHCTLIDLERGRLVLE